MSENPTSDHWSHDGDDIAAAAVRLAGQRGWRGLALGDIAAEAGVTFAQLARCYACRPDILDGFERMIDRAMLAAAVTGETAEKPRDRLFDIIMERFEALRPFRDGVRRIGRELPFDAPSALVLAAAMPRSAALMFAGAGMRIEGPLMPVKIAALSGLYLAVFRDWLRDDSQDLGKTMAALDKRLDRATILFGVKFERPRQASKERAAPTEPAPYAATAARAEPDDPQVS